MCKASRVGALCVWRVRSLYMTSVGAPYVTGIWAQCLSRVRALCVTTSGLSEEAQGSVSIWGQSTVCDLVWGSLYEGSGLHVFGGLGLSVRRVEAPCVTRLRTQCSPRVGAPCVTTSGLNEEGQGSICIQGLGSIWTRVQV